MALLDNGVQVNTITLRYVKEHSLSVGLITDLMSSKVACIGLGNAYTKTVRLRSDSGSSGQSLGL